MELRPYQRESIDSLYDYFSGSDGNPLVVLPTGTGKSVVIAAFLKEAIESWPETRVLMLTHQKELIQQNYLELIKMWPDAPAGIYSAGLNRRDINAKILMAGIQSIHRHAHRVQRCDIVIIDEAHTLGRDDAGMYRKFIKELNEVNAGLLKVVGFTATPYRMDTGLLHEGEERLFTDIAYEVPMLQMSEQGYLCPVVPKRTETQLDVSSVGTRGGEFIAGQLEAAVDQVAITSAAVKEIVELGKDRGSWLIFCSGVKHAEHVRDAIRACDISCETVTGDTPAQERDRTLRAFKAGRLRAVTNMGVLTTGFNAPGTDLIALFRPTKSVGLYVQMVGRGTRIAEGKDDCMILDFAGNTFRHGPVDKVDGARKKGNGIGDAPVKTCPECQTINHASVRICIGCGHEFPPPDPKIENQAATFAVLSSQIQQQWVDVTDVSYSRHQKEGKPPSVCVTYYAGFARHREWLCFEHQGYPRQKACDWWAKRMPGIAAPANVERALSFAPEIPRPVAISVKPVGQYTEIVAVRFE